MVSKMIRLVVLDVDKTVWAHHNASALIGPFKIVSKDIIQDKYYSTVRLNDGIRAFLEFAAKKGIILSLASWNEPENVLDLLSLFDIDRFFIFPVIEPHPNKYMMFQKIVMNLGGKGIRLLPEEILYIDDRDIHLEEIRKSIGNINFLKYGIDVKNWYDVINKVEHLITDH